MILCAPAPIKIRTCEYVLYIRRSARPKKVYFTAANGPDVRGIFVRVASRIIIGTFHIGICTPMHTIYIHIYVGMNALKLHTKDNDDPNDHAHRTTHTHTHEGQLVAYNCLFFPAGQTQPSEHTTFNRRVLDLDSYNARPNCFLRGQLANSIIHIIMFYFFHFYSRSLCFSDCDFGHTNENTNTHTHINSVQCFAVSLF